jgi:hypothetical protein
VYQLSLENISMSIQMANPVKTKALKTIANFTVLDGV